MSLQSTLRSALFTAVSATLLIASGCAPSTPPAPAAPAKSTKPAPAADAQAGSTDGPSEKSEN
ncbi:MAG: hypothetical protein ACKOFW_17960 [Planctomycetaceae bacterium]